MLIKNLAVVACLVTAAMAQNGSIFCQARYITNVATCIIGVKECNTVESFSACVCANSGNKPALRLCLVSLLASPSFRGILKASDFKSLADYEQEAEMAESGAPADK
ncbi:hypothetical protein CPC16_003920 [Podila verticillata]|nr:hypothetical protein BGZ52_007827 [Haplosporangium bisporale]KAF9370108.1 hypothetical protein CPC16_003920 [Podila verticillata]KFH67433.1 hypothetical protein MVEG_06165 [Podila verticillata NRRL 6337]